MTPSILSREIADGLSDFLRTTFPINSPRFQNTLEKMITEPGGLFTGPWVQLRLPFREVEDFTDPFDGLLPPGFRPFLHQEQAFSRLNPFAPQSTLVATGTGSGKTETFLYPILQHCRRQIGRPGIKAILIYPMNALASDQARRFASAIHQHPALRGHVTAGVYLGEGEDFSGRPKCTVMEEFRLIDDRATLRASPPDILLTNYKMLDLLLLRPEDHKLWSRNEPGTLRYLVVDELHTFDGAQGADLACLLRRLKHRLAIPAGHLCCVGTSATLGDSPDAVPALLHYAEKLFGEPFSSDALIGETLQSVDEFLASDAPQFTHVPEAAALQRLPKQPDAYLKAAYRLWFPGAPKLSLDSRSFGEAHVELGRHLRRHAFLRHFLNLLDGQARSFSQLRSQIQKRYSQLLSDGAGAALSPQELDTASNDLLASFIALVSHARRRPQATGQHPASPTPTANEVQPFLPVRVQLWLRELSRVVATVAPEPELRFSDDLSEEDLGRSLPMLHCRECGLTGWGAVSRDGDSRLISDLKTFYAAFFENSARCVFLFDAEDDPGQDSQWSLCPHCLNLQLHTRQQPCQHCGHSAASLLQVWRPSVVKESQHAGGRLKREVPHHCPRCSGHNSLTILGSRAASLLAVAFSQLYQSPFNADKKLLAFSDNVQDASHRAGFFAARTWATNFRTALQQLVSVQTLSQRGIRLSELRKAFAQYFLRQPQVQAVGRNLSDEDFVALFLAPDMDWLEDAIHLARNGSLPQPCDLPRLVLKRIDWHIWAEYTFNSRIGRTLEKSGASMLTPDPALLEQALALLLTELPERMGEFRQVPVDVLRASLEAFLYAFLTELRRKGAVLHSHLFDYIEHDGEVFFLGKRKPRNKWEPWRPAFSPSGRRPQFLSPLARHDSFLTLPSAGASPKAKPSWFDLHFRKSFPFLGASARHLAPDFYRNLLIPILEQTALLARHATSQSPGAARSPYPNSPIAAPDLHAVSRHIWGISSEALCVTLSIEHLRCAVCRTDLQAPTTFVSALVGSPCMNPSCRGSLERAIQPELNFYRQLYQNGELARIYASEHTGLLSRQDRESLEEAFRAPARPASPNLLSCTPTLEMGINIGDLSAVALCSVPPKPANYLQRIGRAGRANGNALLLNVANAKPHDLFFYLEPEEMIRGQVDPPGLFLEAVAVLERQFTAFAFDSWTNASDGQNRVPAKVVDAILGLADPPEKFQRFPNNFFHYFENHRSALEDAFLALFSPTWPEHARELLAAALRDFSRREEDRQKDKLGLRQGIRFAVEQESKERASLKNRLSKLRGLPKSNPALTEEANAEDQRSIAAEERTLTHLLRELENRNLLAFLTDAGLLPNYAFPERGITLRSVILPAVKDPDKPPRSATYVRPASAGLMELAPSNTFYAEGRRLTIDSVSFNAEDYAAWRLCPACNYLAPQRDVSTLAACPRCQSTLFADSGQQKHLLRLRTVTSTMTDFESRSYDETDDREFDFFQRHTFAGFEPSDITRAWSIPDEGLPFGFEFLSRVTLRDVNFGRMAAAGSPSSQKVRIAGRELDDRPFLICEDCGKVKQGDKFRHAPFCRHWNSVPANASQPHKAKDDGLKASFLYREMESEAIRILLPIGIIDAERNLESLVAALGLGLRRHFSGETAHLQTCRMDEPSNDARVRKQYLILFDAVPGGTGYLKDLMREPAAFMSVFRKALEALQTCRCAKDPTKDGCYRCLLYYLGRHHRGNTSRRAAMELLEPIVRSQHRLEQRENLQHIQLNRFLESQLEARFIEALRRWTERSLAKESRIETQIVAGKTGYSLKFGEHQWLLEPQVELGPAQGVSEDQRADFVITPMRPRSGELPIAVYADGFEYHASAGNNRLEKDTRQRLALRHSGRYRYWSLTWDDIDSAFLPESQPEIFQSSLLPANLAVQEKLLARAAFAPRDLNSRNSFALLCDLLTRGRDWSWNSYASSLLLPLKREAALSPDALADRLRELYPATSGFVRGNTFENYQTAPHLSAESRLPDAAQPIFHLDALLPKEFLSAWATQAGGSPGISWDVASEVDFHLPLVLASFEDQPANLDPSLYKAYWRDFLRLGNLLQFLPRAFVLSRQAWLHSDISDHLTQAPGQAGLWGELAQEVDPAFAEFLKWAADCALPLPTPFYEHLSGDSIVASAQLAWPDLSVALLLPHDPEYVRSRTGFESSGFACFSPQDLMAKPETFLARFASSQSDNPQPGTAQEPVTPPEHPNS